MNLNKKILGMCFREIKKAYLGFGLSRRVFLSRTESKGQMAIFVALIFQVLFVFFSMSINIALMVHDKINLQNAVDLAAYYAARKQAEMLNVIAHQNYQIRRAWKLLTWRYRVTGSVGLFDPNNVARTHPVRRPNDPLNSQDGPFTSDPTICTNHKFNSGIRDENLCKRRNFNIPPLPNIPVVAPLPINFQLQQYRRRVGQRIAANCDNLGVYNFWFALHIFNSYRFEQAERKQLIGFLANNLQGAFLDLGGESVSEGAKKVFMKNLSFSNAKAFQNNPQKFQFFNSLSQYQSPKSWLPEISIFPSLNYSNPTPGTGGCNISVTNILIPPRRGYGRLNSPHIQRLATLAGRVNKKELQMTLGVEKNPWILAYVGIKAETQPRPLFWPIGPRLTIKARAFAKPFGGRIGPWHYKSWARGASLSHGTKTDPLLPDRFDQSTGRLNPNSAVNYLPNYSRYPGDRLGLRSRKALIGVASTTPIPRWGKTHFNFSLDYFSGTVAYDVSSSIHFDRLAWDSVLNQAPSYRNYEIAAISPDLFDATYYSTALNGDVYYKALITYWASRNRIKRVLIKPDLGSPHPADRNLPFNSNRAHYSVKGQIEALERKKFRHSKAYWFIKKPQHLLTSWTSSDQALEFSRFPYDRFGQCQVFGNVNPAYPRIADACIAKGGRSGYSVKLVSRDFLFSDSYTVGNSRGSIKNPPPPDF